MIGSDCWNIINDYKNQLEKNDHKKKLNKCLNIIRINVWCNKCGCKNRGNYIENIIKIMKKYTTFSAFDVTCRICDNNLLDGNHEILHHFMNYYK